MSTDLTAFLNYIASLNTASDQQIQDVIDERKQFILLGKSPDMMTKINASIDSVFDKIDDLASKLLTGEIADESIQLAEDAAAVAAIWSFGLSMAAFAVLASIDAALQAAIKAKEESLHQHLANADQDIANSVGGACAKYISLVKSNNNFIKASSPKGLTPLTARSYLYYFIEYISRNGGTSVANFKTCIELVRHAKDAAEIDKIYDILDKFTVSDDHGEEKIKEAFKEMKDTGINTQYLHLARSFTVMIWMYKMHVSAKEISKAAAAPETEVPPEEAEVSVLENIDSLGQAMFVYTIIISIVDAFLTVYNIVKTMERYFKSKEIYAEARKQYKAFYKGLHDASVKYNTN